MQTIEELLVTGLSRVEVEVLEEYGVLADQVSVKGKPYTNLIFPAGSTHRKDETRGSDRFVITLPGRWEFSYWKSKDSLVATLRDPEL